jgi:chromosome segregation protein
MNAKAGDLEQHLAETTASLQSAEENQSVVAKRLVEAERNLTDMMASLDQLRGEDQQQRAEHLKQMRDAAALGNAMSALESQVAEAEASQGRAAQRIAELDRSLDGLQQQLDALRRSRDEGAGAVEAAAQALAEMQDKLAESRRRHGAKKNELGEQRERRSAAAERAAMLEELVRRNEGISAGVKDILQRAAERKQAALKNIRGLVADMLRVSVEAAPLVEIALGQTSQHLVATRSPELLELLQAEGNRYNGRVGFVWLDAPHAPPKIDLKGRPGVLGRADAFVETQPEFASLAAHLLDRTWFVEKLPHAFALAESAAGATFVTLAGELLESDGTLTVGPRNISTGLISRRSQLRALAGQLTELDAAIAAGEAELAALDEQIQSQQEAVDRRSADYRRAVDALSENRVAISAAEEHRRQSDGQRAALDRELQDSRRRHDAAKQQLDASLARRKEIDAAIAELEASLAAVARQTETLESRRAAAHRETTEIKVHLAKCEEQLRNLQAAMRQFQESREERQRAIDDARQHLQECTARSDASRWSILQTESEIAELYLRKENVGSRTVGLIERRDALSAERAEIASQAQSARNRIRKLEEKLHAAEMTANEVRLERTNMAERLREDYGIETSVLEASPTGDELHAREEVQREIDELRQKINNLGNVNLEALEELDQLESRFGTLSDQFKDLSSAKNSLEKIIEKINADSRRLFSETLETVRGHFQQLFRDLFGGGRADIVLEENVDILDSGIEIVARPPGKEPRSISLLSGGEKTMTCVALLLAIFRSRPSPFCVLDEVDAALDESNIDRFTKVIQNFLTWTQFIIITHSKKTMTCATTIYGVTMQESGVTKQVSVRFEDVSEDGQIIEQPKKKDEKDKKDETQAA